MSDSSSYKRSPAIHCWIKHIKEAMYDEDKKIFHTIFGRAKRVRILATITSKKEKLTEIKEDKFEEEIDIDSNIGLDFDFDDGTGSIKGLIRNINPDYYKKFNPGDLVDVIGRVSKWQDFVSLWIEIIKKVEQPNFILLRNAEIIKKIKLSKIQKIPAGIQDIEEFSNEIDIDNLLEEGENDNEIEIKKEEVYFIIRKYSVEGNGVDFEKIKEEAKISDIELRTYLNDLILESRIYESDENIYESF
ncbi:MAG: hypothetical protein ACFFB0_18115 [Promethearchaeota archaeon]